jgi:hypothetical protein
MHMKHFCMQFELWSLSYLLFFRERFIVLSISKIDRCFPVFIWQTTQAVYIWTKLILEIDFEQEVLTILVSLSLEGANLVSGMDSVNQDVLNLHSFIIAHLLLHELCQLNELTTNVFLHLFELFIHILLVIPLHL